MSTRSQSSQSSPLAVLERYLKEPVNSLTHLVGAFLSVAGLVVLVVLSEGEPWRVTSFAVYGATSILLYTASTLLHALEVSERTERWLRRFDHAAIFALIAGSYTPIALITLRAEYASVGWTIFAVVWSIALLGIVFKVVWIDAPRWLSTVLYVLMGWLAVVAFVPLIQSLPLGGMAWLVSGGLFYTVGAVVFAIRRPNLFPGVLGYHELWHLFVLAGGASHFVMMLRYVLPG